MAQKILLNEPIERSSPYTVYKRLLYLVLAAITLVVTLNVWVFGARQDVRVQQNMANQLGAALAEQGADIAAQLGVTTESAAAILSSAARDKHVLSATLYNDKGQVISHEGDNQSLLSLQRQASSPPLVYVKEVRVDGEVRAYLRLLLDRATVLEHQQDYQTGKRHQTELLMVLSLMLGIFLTRGVYKLKARRGR